jgi:hypothetical protein
VRRSNMGRRLLGLARVGRRVAEIGDYRAVTRSGVMPNPSHAARAIAQSRRIVAAMPRFHNAGSCLPQPMFASAQMPTGAPPPNCARTSARDFTNVDQIEQRLPAFQQRYSATARPFKRTFTFTDLDDLLARIEHHQQQNTPPLGGRRPAGAVAYGGMPFSDERNQAALVDYRPKWPVEFELLTEQTQAGTVQR